MAPGRAGPGKVKKKAKKQNAVRKTMGGLSKVRKAALRCILYYRVEY
jgi:hypothetical protein